MTVRVRLALVATLVAPALAVAGPVHMRPGLWEETVQTRSDDPRAADAMAKMKERMAAMTPEQRAMMDKAMASRGLGMGGAGGNAVRVCISKEQAERDIGGEHNEHCSRTDVVRSGDTIRFKFTCSTARSTMTGNGTFTLNGDTAFTGTNDLDMTMTQSGKTTHTHSEVSGKFVGSDCGDIKPFDAPKPGTH